MSDKEYNPSIFDLMSDDEKAEHERTRPKSAYIILGLYAHEGGGGVDAYLQDFSTVKAAYEWCVNTQKVAKVRFGSDEVYSAYPYDYYQIVALASFSLVVEFDCIDFNQSSNLEDDPFFGESMWVLKNKGLLDIPRTSCPKCGGGPVTWKCLCTPMWRPVGDTPR